jgi:hypothetical protein
MIVPMTKVDVTGTLFAALTLSLMPAANAMSIQDRIVPPKIRAARMNASMSVSP